MRYKPSGIPAIDQLALKIKEMLAVLKQDGGFLDPYVFSLYPARGSFGILNIDTKAGADIGYDANGEDTIFCTLRLLDGPETVATMSLGGFNFEDFVVTDAGKFHYEW